MKRIHSAAQTDGVDVKVLNKKGQAERDKPRRRRRLARAAEPIG